MKILNVIPCAKPRMTQSDKWKKRPEVMKYLCFKDEIYYEFRRSRASLEDVYNVVFVLPMPKSWSNKKKKKMFQQPHQQRPDVDNLTKAFLDSLYDEDSTVYDFRSRKFWGYGGKIIIIEEVEDEMLIKDCIT